MRRSKFWSVLLLGGLVALSGCTTVRDRQDWHEPTPSNDSDGGPPQLDALGALKAQPLGDGKHEGASAEQMRDAAFSYGAQAGLARRFWEIDELLDARAKDLDQVWDFRPLVLPQPDGVIVPPVVEIRSNDFKFATDGQSGSSVATRYRLTAPAKLAAQPPDWRQYLRHPPKPATPPSGLALPRTDEEREQWQVAMAEGWAQGQHQAETAFHDDLARLKRDFVGMARYRGMVRQGSIAELYLVRADLGVTGGDQEMRVGERLLRIVEPARLKSGEWAPPVVIDPLP